MARTERRSPISKDGMPSKYKARLNMAGKRRRAYEEMLDEPYLDISGSIPQAEHQLLARCR